MPVSTRFSYELDAAPAILNLRNVAAGWGALTIDLEGLLDGDVVQQAAATFKPLLGVSITKTVNAIAGVDGQVTAGATARSRTIRFTLTAVDVAAIATGTYSYAVRVWVLRAGETRDREVVVGTIAARASVVPVTGVSAVATIVVTGTSAGVAGATSALTATAKDVGGNVIPGVVFAWTSSNPNVAQVDAAGIVTFVATGVATISAVASGVVGTLAVTCSDALFVAPNAGDVMLYSAGAWRPLSPSNLTNLDAASLTSGLIPAARVPAAAVTQHQAALAIGIAQLTGYGLAGGYLRSDGLGWTRSPGVPWADVTGAPATYAPSAHFHAPNELTGFGADAGYLRSNGTGWERVSGLAAADLTGTVASARLVGAYGGITGIGTLTGLNVSGASALQELTATTYTGSGLATSAGFALSPGSAFLGAPTRSIGGDGSSETDIWYNVPAAGSHWLGVNAAVVARVNASGITMAPGTALAAQAITGTTLALSGGVTGATGRFGSSTSHSYILGAVVGASADAEVFLAGMEGVTNGISYRRVAGAFEFRVATGNAIIADGTLSAQAITGTTLTLTGLLLTAASALGGAGLRLPHGAAPTSPTNGDVWTTSAGMFVQINGVTKTVTLT